MLAKKYNEGNILKARTQIGTKETLLMVLQFPYEFHRVFSRVDSPQFFFGRDDPRG